MRFHPESTPSKSSIARAIKPVLENLERRQMLAVVEGGQIGYYQNSAGQTIRFEVRGGGAVAAVGSSLNGTTGRAQLNDIPMTILDAETGELIRENLGGFGGRDGVAPVTEITQPEDTREDSLMRSETGGFYGFAPAARIAFEALATNTNGRTYALARRTEGPGASADNPAYDVVGVNNTTGRVEVLDSIAGKILTALQADEPEFEAEGLGTLIGADFDPSNPDILYIALNVEYPFGSGDNITTKEVPAMFTYNIRSETLGVVSYFGADSSQDNEYQVFDFTFLDDDRIAFFGSIQQAGSNNTREGLFITDKNAIGADGFQLIGLSDGESVEEITEIAAMEAIDSQTILLVDDQSASAQLIRIDLDTEGDVLAVSAAGDIVDPDEPTAKTDKRGAGIADLSFNPRLQDSFGFQVGRRGVLLGADVGTDELVAVDSRLRFTESDIYAIYDTEATSDTSISITEITPNSNQNLSFEQRLFRGISNPYGTNAGGLATFMVDPGQDAPLTIPLNNGGVFIGGRSNNAEDQQVIPVLELSSDRGEDGDYVGSLPGVRLPAIVNPGIYLSGSVDDIYIAGTITGRVSINGSVDTFYAGNVITGDPLGGSDLSVDNFFVAGDLRNLIVAGGIGTMPNAPTNFYPQTDFAIGGRVMQMKAGGNWQGAIDVVGKTNSTSNRDIVTELETVVRAVGNNVVNAFNNFQLANQEWVRNDDFDSPQMLASISDNRGRGGAVTVSGSINNGPNFNDNRDVYGLSLLAGEGATIQLQSDLADVNLEVYDPAGRLYHTDFSNQNNAGFLNQAINFTADKPGIWRVVAAPIVPGVKVDAVRTYTLSLDRIGSISLGGLVATNVNINKTPDVNSNIGVQVRNGDLGAILAENELWGADSEANTGSREFTAANPIWAQRGSIRALEAGAIRHLVNGSLSGYPFVLASNKIGSIQSDGDLYINGFESIGSTGKPSVNLVTGGDIQVIEAGGNFSGVLATRGSIGVIRVGSFDAVPTAIAGPSYIQINADGRGADELGLIDVVGSFGNVISGGPALSAGNGSNIRYIRVGGAIYRDAFFGLGSTFVQTATDDSITVTDDTGAEVSVKPVTGTFTRDVDTTTGGGGTDTTPGGDDGDTGTGGGGVPTSSNGYPDPFGGSGGSIGGGGVTLPNPFGNGGTGGLGGLPDPFGFQPPVVTDPEEVIPDGSTVTGTLRLDTLPVRSGGFVITSVVSSTGVTVATNREGGGGVADISRIETGTEGTPLVTDEDGNLVADSGTLLDIILVGNSRINVFVIDGPTAEYSRIDNFTDGEIVNINAESVAVIAAEWVGVSRNVASTKIEGVEDVVDGRFGGVANLYPFNGAKNMIFLTEAGTIGARGPLGNITIQERVQFLVANAGNRNVKGVAEGIVAPVLVYSNGTTPGTIDRIEIGEGLAYSGSGETGFAGVYSTDRLGTITNINGGGDLRGDVIVRNYIDRINLTGNGSIVDADIYQVDVGAGGSGVVLGRDGDIGFRVGIEVRNFIPGIQVVDDTPESPIGVGKINVAGRGGLLNARVVGANIGKVTVNRGSFGVINSAFYSTTGGTMGGISADGLGIRGVTYSGGSFTGDLIATGTGKLRNIDEFSRSARTSEVGSFDVGGKAVNTFNDLNLFLGTDKEIREIDGVTNEGYVEDSIIQANRTIRSVQGFEIKVRQNPGNTFRPRDETYPMQINTGGTLPLVRSQRDISGLRVVAGTVGTIQSGNDIRNFFLQSTGAVDTVSAKRNILGSSNLNLITSASLNRLIVGRNMNGTAFVARGIRSITVGGNLTSAKEQGGIYTSTNINLIDIGGSVTAGAYLAAKNVIKSLVIDGNVEDGAEVLAKSIQNKNINGEVEGTVS